jgi:hypothetical protein
METQKAHMVLTSFAATQNSVITKEIYIPADSDGTGVCSQSAAFDG